MPDNDLDEFLIIVGTNVSGAPRFSTTEWGDAFYCVTCGSEHGDSTVYLGCVCGSAVFTTAKRTL
jgi:hypothetical protein